MIFLNAKYQTVVEKVAAVPILRRMLHGRFLTRKAKRGMTGSHLKMLNPFTHLQPVYSWLSILMPALYCRFKANQSSLKRGPRACELADELTRIFGQIGKCWVKVRFDPAGIPVAFVQYKVKSSIR